MYIQNRKKRKLISAFFYIPIAKPLNNESMPIFFISDEIENSLVPLGSFRTPINIHIYLDKYDDGDNSVANGENTPQHTDGL